MHPQPRVRILVVSMHTSIHSEPPESPGIPARNGFNGFLRALPGDRLSCHRRLRIESASLNASIEASGPHDFAVRFRAIRQRRSHVHRIPPRVRDDRERPSIGTGWRINKTVSTERRNEIFFETGLDRKSLGSLIDLPVGQITRVYKTHARHFPIAKIPQGSEMTRCATSRHSVPTPDGPQFSAVAS
jgi:hypothetical protein